MFYWLSTYSRASLSFAGIIIAGLVVWLAVNSTETLAISQLQQHPRPALHFMKAHCAPLSIAIDICPMSLRGIMKSSMSSPETALWILPTSICKGQRPVGRGRTLCHGPNRQNGRGKQLGNTRQFRGSGLQFPPLFHRSFRRAGRIFYGIGVTTGRSGLFISHPISKSGEIVGVVAVKIELDELERNWQDGAKQSLFQMPTV